LADPISLQIRNAGTTEALLGVVQTHLLAMDNQHLPAAFLRFVTLTEHDKSSLYRMNRHPEFVKLKHLMQACAHPFVIVLGPAYILHTCERLMLGMSHTKHLPNVYYSEGYQIDFEFCFLFVWK
jgi:hypothetical protein